MNLEIDYLWSHKCPKKWNQYTLIALIITIIVILILAGVTIATLTGDNGLLKKASTSKEKNEESSALEKIKLEVAGSYGLDGKIDIKNQLNQNLFHIKELTYNNKTIKLGGNDQNIIEELPATVKLNGYAFTIFENGNVEKDLFLDEYQKVEYIESSGTQYIDTGFIANQDTRLVFEGTMQYAKWTAYHLFGGRKSYTENIFLFGTYDNNYETKFNNQNTAFKTDAIAVRATVDKNKNVTTIYVNGKSEYSTTQTYEEFNSGVSLYLFATHTEIGNNPIGIDGKKRCFSCKIWDDKKLVRNFIPCYRYSDKKPGLFDTVEGKFYTNQDNGDDFIAGPEV